MDVCWCGVFLIVFDLSIMSFFDCGCTRSDAVCFEILGCFCFSVLGGSVCDDCVCGNRDVILWVCDCGYLFFISVGFSLSMT